MYLSQSVKFEGFYCVYLIFIYSSPSLKAIYFFSYRNLAVFACDPQFYSQLR